MLRPNYLGSCTNCNRWVGLVCMGCVLFSPVRIQNTKMDLEYSIGELFGWRKNRTATRSTGRISTLVSLLDFRCSHWLV